METATEFGYGNGILRDSHAEVICRRALLRLLYSDLTILLKSELSSHNQNEIKGSLLESSQQGETHCRFQLK